MFQYTCPSFWFHYPFETSYSMEDARAYFSENKSVMYMSIAIYLFGVHYGQKWMECRKPYNLKWPLFFWNVALALFSIAGVVRSMREMHVILTEHDFNTSVCVRNPPPGCNVRAYWMALFTLSKIVELGDTAFIILRKRKLIFLHWYHHVTVLYMTWIAAVDGFAAGRYFVTINFFIHSLMYTYYALQSFGIKTKKIVSMTITTLQILQMVAGLFIAYYAIQQLFSGKPCDASWYIIQVSLLTYGSYFVLFANYFYQTYIVSSKQGASQSKQLDKRRSPQPKSKVK